jgi:hypothetical protein
MSRNKSTKPKLNLDKSFNLTESKTFCMAPWVHLHTTPTGLVAPCCISTATSTEHGFGNSKDNTIEELINVEEMKKLRVDMLSGVENIECNGCYAHEKNNIKSFRQMHNEELGKFYDSDVLENTNKNGSLKKFTMRYFDMRFNNICNFKCRTCGPFFSSQWEQENLKNNVVWAKPVPKNNKPEFLEELLTHVDYLDSAYFAGGEPLITDEHYVMLEEMIKKNRTDIKLRYNTNLSNLKFKDKDLLSLWKHFKNPVDVYASIDHFGEKAEYIRHGTDWATVEENFQKVKSTKFIKVYINTVLSVFNYMTLHEFFQYLIDKKFYNPRDGAFTVYKMSTPAHFAAHIIPEKLKLIGKDNISKLHDYMKIQKFKKEQLKQIEDINAWVCSTDTWDLHQDAFRLEINRVDKIRGERFSKVFPELSELVDRKRFFPL